MKLLPPLPKCAMGRSIARVVLVLVLLGHGALAQSEICSDPVALTRTPIPARADTKVSVPLTQAPLFVGTLESVSGNLVTISGSPQWSENQFMSASGGSMAYLVIGGHETSSPKQGREYSIVANGTRSVRVELNGDDLSTVSAETEIQIIPYWTLGTLFPAADEGDSFLGSQSAFGRGTKILLPNYAGIGINLRSRAVYYFFNGGWRMQRRPVTELYNDVILLPHSYFTVRTLGRDSAVTLSTTGSVAMGQLSVALGSERTSRQDNPVSLLRPLPVSLNESGLIASHSFTPSLHPTRRADLLLVAADRLERTQAATYFYFNGGWRKLGQRLNLDFGNDRLAVGHGFIIRKARTLDGATAFWSHTASYQ